MSHIFISYSRTDIPHLDRLLTWLKESDFTDHDIWYDKQIESGNNWRDEITNALNEAFVVLVVVSENSLKSQYCTYEWAYAMGQDIPILPLVFEEVMLTDVPAPLASRQFIGCVECISDALKEQIMQLRSAPPQVKAINKIIFDTIYDTHKRFFILASIGERLNDLDDEKSSGVISYFARKADEARKVLETLMIEKAYAFNSRQHRMCWRLIDCLETFSKLDFSGSRYSGICPILKFDREWDSWVGAFEYFEGREHDHRLMRDYFDADLDQEPSRIRVITEMSRAFPNFNAVDVEILIKNMNRDQRIKRETQTIPVS